jgi:uncharacterized repeat protein (TIGR03803 family)
MPIVGGSGYGTLFKITSDGTFTTLHALNGTTEGESPNGGLVLATDGYFYGTTYNSGGSDGTGKGTIFKMTPAGALTTLYTFTGGTDGEYPQAGLTLGADSSLYGATPGWLDQNLGSLFALSPQGVFTILHTFLGGSDGCGPEGGLVFGPDSNLYGTTRLCVSGPQSYPTIFSATTSGQVTPAYVDSNYGSNGPDVGYTSLVRGIDGKSLYGTTVTGGSTGQGSVFVFEPYTQVFTRLYSFTGSTDGGAPNASLALGSDGNLYGTTGRGGANGLGTIFRVSPTGSLTTLHSFTTADGSNPMAALVQGSDGNFYGVTLQGGASSDGTVFKLQVALAPPPPAWLKASSTVSQTVNLSWEASAGANTYSVYMGTTSNGESAKPIKRQYPATSVRITGLTSGTRYYFKVAAANANGIGLMSPEATAKAK